MESKPQFLVFMMINRNASPSVVAPMCAFNDLDAAAAFARERMLAQHENGERGQGVAFGIERIGG